MLVTLTISAAMVILTVGIHMTGLFVLLEAMHKRIDKIRPHENYFRQSVFIMLTVFGLFIVHMVEVLAYALVYVLIGQMPTFFDAVYFSLTTFTTVGFGDVILEGDWRMMAAVESLNGFLLIGWSTAFLLDVLGRIRAIEIDWLEDNQAER